jgi:hypothetical protein
MLNFVNEKTINGVLYTALRDSENPAQQYIMTGEKMVTARHKDYWNDEAKLLTLFNGN